MKCVETEIRSIIHSWR